MTQAEENELTNDQRKENLNKFDTLADGISGSATTLGGLNTLGLFAGTVKSETLLNAVVYTLPILAFGAALVYALLVKYFQWNMTLNTYDALVAKKQRFYGIALILLIVGVILLFVATLLYVARSINGIVFIP
ncbi:MAG: hypothetical protein PVS3B3_21220 [Ktedonobacteraceae bacterium]